MLPNDIRFAETKPLNEGRTSFLVVTCCYAPVEGLAGFAGWNWLAVRVTVSLYCSFYGSSPVALSKFEKYNSENRPGDSLKTGRSLQLQHLCTFAPRLTCGHLSSSFEKSRIIPSHRIISRRFSTPRFPVSNSISAKFSNERW